MGARYSGIAGPLKSVRSTNDRGPVTEFGPSPFALGGAPYLALRSCRTRAGKSPEFFRRPCLRQLGGPAMSPNSVMKLSWSG